MVSLWLSYHKHSLLRCYICGVTVVIIPQTHPSVLLHVWCHCGYHTTNTPFCVVTFVVPLWLSYHKHNLLCCYMCGATVVIIPQTHPSVLLHLWCHCGYHTTHTTFCAAFCATNIYQLHYLWCCHVPYCKHSLLWCYSCGVMVAKTQTHHSMVLHLWCLCVTTQTWNL